MIVSEKFRIFASGNANRVDWQLLMWTKERRRYEKGIYCCDYFVRCGAGGDDAGFYLQSHMRVDDYYVATVGMLNYKGVNLPVTLGILGKVYVLVDEEQVKRMIRQ